MLCGFDDDLAKQATAASNRIRGLLTQIHPALERVIGPHLDHPAMAELLSGYPTPDALRRAGQTRVAALLRKLAPRAGKRWAAEVFAALDEQTVVVVRHQRRRHRAAPAGRAAGRSCALPGPRSWPGSKPSWRPTLFTSS